MPSIKFQFFSLAIVIFLLWLYAMTPPAYKFKEYIRSEKHKNVELFDYSKHVFFSSFEDYNNHQSYVGIAGIIF